MLIHQKVKDWHKIGNLKNVREAINLFSSNLPFQFSFKLDQTEINKVEGKFDLILGDIYCCFMGTRGII